MVNTPKKKQSTNKQFEQAIIRDIHTSQSLLSTELIVIDEEISLLKRRIEVMKDFLKTLSQTDPQYGMVAIAIDMDQVNLDDTLSRKQTLLQKLDQINNI